MTERVHSPRPDPTFVLRLMRDEGGRWEVTEILITGERRKFVVDNLPAACRRVATQVSKSNKAHEAK